MLLLFSVILLLVGVTLFILIRRKSSKLVTKLHQLSHRFHHLIEGIHLFGDPTSYVKLFTFSLLIWTFSCLSIWAVLASLGTFLTFNQIILLLGIMGISVAIPAAPAWIGTLQYVFYITAVLIGIPTSAAIAASALVQVPFLGGVTVIGWLIYNHVLATHLVDTNQVN